MELNLVWLTCKPQVERVLLRTRQELNKQGAASIISGFSRMEATLCRFCLRSLASITPSYRGAETTGSHDTTAFQRLLEIKLICQGIIALYSFSISSLGYEETGSQLSACHPASCATATQLATESIWFG